MNVQSFESFTPDFSSPRFLSQALTRLNTTLQTIIAQAGDLHAFRSLFRCNEAIEWLKNMAEMHLLNPIENQRITEKISSLEEELQSFNQDLFDRIQMAEKELWEIVLSFQNGNTRAKIIFLLSRLPTLFCQQLSEKEAQEMRKHLIKKISPLQKTLSEMPPLEQGRFRKKLEIIEETFVQKSPLHPSEKDLDTFFHNLQS